MQNFGIVLKLGGGIQITGEVVGSAKIGCQRHCCHASISKIYFTCGFTVGFSSNPNIEARTVTRVRDCFLAGCFAGYTAIWAGIL